MIGVAQPRSAVSDEPRWVRVALIAIALAFLGIFLVVPLVVVFHAAFEKGWHAYTSALAEPDTRSAIKLTLTAAAIAVPLNIGFGVAAAWSITRFRFPGKRVLVTIIDLPFAVSPVIAGMLFILLFGAQGIFGPWLSEHAPSVKIIFAVPAIVIVTAFVTIPFVARELIPALEARGPEQELAALTLGASPWQTFRRVTLPNIGWPLAYGAILCTARAVGEFGAVSVVSGHIRGQTNTIPLHVEILYNDFQYQAAFAVSTILIFIAVVTIAIKSAIEWRISTLRAAHASPAPRRSLAIPIGVALIIVGVAVALVTFRQADASAVHYTLTFGPIVAGLALVARALARRDKRGK
ncbi:MAG TPA: sulfate ABC transporter permease subunit CysW [Kofleriaceae bacterium]|nr:sulfate ABC transporter permease subunit CysW [Kofleriaceae bacterium]